MIIGILFNGMGRWKRQSLEDDLLLDARMEERTTDQRMQAASGSWINKKIDSALEPPEKNLGQLKP